MRVIFHTNRTERRGGVERRQKRSLKASRRARRDGSRPKSRGARRETNERRAGEESPRETARVARARSVSRGQARSDGWIDDETKTTTEDEDAPCTATPWRRGRARRAAAPAAA
eukprot:31277-Pelagococcus_subviridis.AAC.3